MGKIIFWILVGMALVLLLRNFGPRGHGQRGAGWGRRGRGGDGERREEATTHDVMLACSVCQVHLPASEAIFAGGKVYCCAEHRDQGRALPAGRQGD